MPLYAHSHHVLPRAEWHLLSTHLAAVSAMAGHFADAFGGGAAAAAAGALHDVGKSRAEFQQYIKDSTTHGSRRGTVDHSASGADIAARALDRAVRYPVALAVAGHHGGLPSPTQLRQRLQDNEHMLASARAGAQSVWTDAGVVSGPAFLAPQPGDTGLRHGLRYDLFTRMLFSALVDADYLDTEAYLAPMRATARLCAAPGLAELDSVLAAHLDHLERAAAAGLRTNTAVNRLRADLRRQVVSEAPLPPGVFTLAVPTGLGKTLTGLQFAVRHALHHNKRRIVVVAPFTSILEQTGAAYRRVLGDAAVLEHYSTVDPQAVSPWTKLASENWDAPIVVTTTVQFFESLFANRPSRCRKLHRLANSVVILDEVQTLPVGFLASIVDVLQALCDQYGMTLILSTATVPALAGASPVSSTPRRVGAGCTAQPIHGAGGPRPAPSARGYPVLRGTRALATVDVTQLPPRVRVEWPQSCTTPTPWPVLAARLRLYEQVLCIVHRRADARSLCALLPDDTFHLSARMTPAHRSTVITAIRERLAHNLPCRVVATQLIEAGVDLDFPVVFRALAGLDALAQAAGRCNREGLLGPSGGRFVVFVAESSPPRGILATAAGVTRSMLNTAGVGGMDLLDPATHWRFFDRLYQLLDHDAQGIQRLRAALNFPEVAERFQLIESEHQGTVVVLYPQPDATLSVQIQAVLAAPMTRDGMRLLQRYMVSVPLADVGDLSRRAGVRPLCDGCLLLDADTAALVYSSRYGFDSTGSPARSIPFVPQLALVSP